MKTNKNSIALYLSFACMAVLFSCGSGEKKLTADEFYANMIATEDSIYTTKTVKMTPEKAEDLLAMYEEYVNSYMDAENVASVLFKAGELAMSLKDSEKALANFERLYKAHPGFDKAAYALFLQGFIYENFLMEYGKAEDTYKKFMDAFPEHELYKDANFSIQNMGKSPEELLKEFEAKAQEAS
ncbi:MAG: tetratricopeptide repeat protein [Flavobacteriales bacterium]|nr:tetratricopeptide repeat protein [Flavobacteriales bacterium]